MRPLAWAALTVAIVAVLAVSPVGVGAAQPDPQAACTDMLQGQGMGEEGRQAMQDLMRSGKAPELMDRMMQMARRLGNGDVMGETKPRPSPQQ